MRRLGSRRGGKRVQAVFVRCDVARNTSQFLCTCSTGEYHNFVIFLSQTLHFVHNIF